MAHVMKMTKGAVGHMTKHYERAKDENGEYVKFGNEDIDLSRTHLNYNLAPTRPNQVKFIQYKCDDLKCLNRKDVNVMCSWVVTLPKDFPKEQEREFFQQAYKFLEKRYGGARNVISAYVHKDENTPHMHFAFVPEAYDKNKGRYKLSAKLVVNKTDLQRFHGDLSKHMENYFGRDVGILNEATKEGNKAIEELKRGTAQEKLENMSKMRENALKQLREVDSNIKYLQEEKKVLEKQLEGYKDLKGSVIDGVTENKTLFGKVKSVTMPKNTYEACVSAQFRANEAENRADNLGRRFERLKESSSTHEVERLKQQNGKLQEKVHDLTNTVQEQSKNIKLINATLLKHPDIKDLLSSAVKQDQKSKPKEKDFDRDR